MATTNHQSRWNEKNYQPPTDAQNNAAHLALKLTDAQLAHELTLAACPSIVMPDELRSALMVEAGARLRTVQRGATRPLWMQRYDESRNS